MTAPGPRGVDGGDDGPAASESRTTQRGQVASRRARRRPLRAPDAQGFARARGTKAAEDQARLEAAITRRGYDLLAPVGDGGMGRVWLARARGAGVVAIKAMLPKVAGDPQFRAMFLDEGRLASRIVSPHVARVFALHDEDGVLFQVMEWIDGESLLDLHRAAQNRRASIPIAVVLRAIAGACDGLHAAHELKDDRGALLQVVHRDVSPANVLVSAGGVAKLVDFGIAKASERIAASTLGFALKGRVHYVAPEYVMGQGIDRRADVWSMGATLYFLLAGRPPYAASNEAAAIFKLTSGEPIPPLPAAVPADVAAVVRRALARDPAARYQTAAELRDALEAVALAIDPNDARSVIAAYVARNESDDARERRRMAEAAADDRAPAEGDAPDAAPSDSADADGHADAETTTTLTIPQAFAPAAVPVRRPRAIRIAAGIVASALVGATLLAFGATDGVAAGARPVAIREPHGPKVLHEPRRDAFLEVYSARAHAASPPRTRAVESPPREAEALSPVSPAKRRYGF
jgi:serine/threonine-protein kinase